MSFLERKIREASQKYYSGEESGVTDKEWDADMEQLKKENPNSPLISEVGHGYQVELDSTSGQKCRHRYSVAGSLDKAYSWSELSSELRATMHAHDVVCSMKLDGLSVVLYYQKGRLMQALTRGKDNIGIDITKKVLKIEPGFSDIHDSTFTGAFRGEIVMRIPEFDVYKQHHLEASNSRNTAAGLINAKEISDDLKYLQIRVYTLFGYESGLDDILVRDKDGVPTGLSYLDMSEYIWNHFVHRICPYSQEHLTEENYAELLSNIKEEMEFESELPADGIVINHMLVELVPCEDEYTLEVVHDNIPMSVKYVSQAFKFKSEEKETTVLGVHWNLTKNRRVMPTVIFQPIELLQTTVQRCTGYNAEYILNHRINQGARIAVEKRGEIIPNINKVLEPCSKDLIMIPTTCPHCNTKLVWKGVDLMCPNEDCENAYMQDVLMWCKHIAPVDGLGDVLITKFLKDRLDKVTIDSVMSLAGRFSYDEKASGQERKFQDMLYALMNRPVYLADALVALNIPRLGEETAKKLAKYPDTCKELISCIKWKEAYQTLNSILGEADSKSIADNMKKYHRLGLIWDRVVQVSTSHESIPVAVTGKLSVPRKQFEKELEQNGFVAKSISKKTQILITDDPNSATDKNRKADEWGIRKMTEQEFRSQYNM